MTTVASAALQGGGLNVPRHEVEKSFDPLLAEGANQAGYSAPAAADRGISGDNLGLMLDVELNVLLRFGQRKLSLREVLVLRCSSVIELDRRVEEPVELLLDGRVIARGEAAIVDGNYGLRITQVASPSHAIPDAG